MPLVSRKHFQDDTNTLYPDNTSGQISPADLRAQMDNIADSVAFRSILKTNAPTVNDDSAGNGGNGEFNEGDIWIDETNDRAYICADDTSTAAVWLIIGGDLVVTRTGITPSLGQVAIWESATEVNGSSSLTWNNNSRLALVSNTPIIELDDNDAPSNNQRWHIWSDFGTLKFQALTDAGVGGPEHIRITRSDEQVTSLQLTTGGFARTTIAPNAVSFGLANSDVQTLGEFDLRFGTNTTTRLTIGSSGNVTVAGTGASNMTFNIGDENTSTGNIELQVGSNRSGDGAARINLVSDTTYSAYATQISRAAGENGAASLLQRGTGTLGIRTIDAAAIEISTNDTVAIRVSESDQSTTFTSHITAPVQLNEQNGTSYTLVINDANARIIMNNAGANTLTIPTNASVEFPIGTEIRVLQIGAGATSITGDTGVTLNGVSAGSGAMSGAGQYTDILKIGTDIWWATGDIGAVS